MAIDRPLGPVIVDLASLELAADERAPRAVEPGLPDYRTALANLTRGRDGGVLG
jgi:hypothetical protein